MSQHATHSARQDLSYQKLAWGQICTEQLLLLLESTIVYFGLRLGCQGSGHRFLDGLCSSKEGGLSSHASLLSWEMGPITPKQHVPSSV